MRRRKDAQTRRRAGLGVANKQVVRFLRRLDQELDARGESPELLLVPGDVAQHARARPSPLPEAKMQEIALRTRAQVADQVVESVVDELKLGLGRPPAQAIVGGAGERERSALLDRVARRARLGSGPVHAGMDPFVWPKPPGETVFLAEGLLAPALPDLLADQGRAVAVTSDAETWGGWLDAPLLVRVNYLPALPHGRAAVEQTTALVAAVPGLDAASALGELGLPAPARWLSALSGATAHVIDDALGRTGLFDRLTSGELVAYVARDRLRLARFLEEAGGDPLREQLLVSIASVTQRTEAGPFVALLQRLASAGRRDFARTLVDRVGHRLRDLVELRPAVVLGWARVLRAAGAPGLARTLLEADLIDSRGDPYLARELALVLLDEGRNREARSILEELAQRLPEQVAVLRSLAMLEVRGRALDRARSLIDRALERSPDDPHLLLDLARMLGEYGDSSAADRHFEKARDAAPECSAVLSEWAKSLAAQGRYAEAVERQERAIGMEWWNVSHRLDLAEIHWQAGDRQRARETVETVLSVWRENPDARLALARIDAEPDQSTTDLATRPSELPPVRRIGDLRGSWRRALERAGRVITATFDFDPGLAPPALPAAPLPLAAALDRTGRSWSTYSDGDAWVALAIGGEGRLRAIVESRGRAIEGAHVSLFELGSAEVPVERASGITDEHGEADLGLAEPHESLLVMPGQDRWHVRVVLPPAQDEAPEP